MHDSEQQKKTLRRILLFCFLLVIFPTIPQCSVAVGFPAPIPVAERPVSDLDSFENTAVYALLAIVVNILSAATIYHFLKLYAAKQEYKRSIEWGFNGLIAIILYGLSLIGMALFSPKDSMWADMTLISILGGPYFFGSTFSYFPFTPIVTLLFMSPIYYLASKAAPREDKEVDGIEKMKSATLIAGLITFIIIATIIFIVVLIRR